MRTGGIGAAIASTALALVVLLAAFTDNRTGTALGGVGLTILGVESTQHPHLPSSLGLAGGAAASAAAVTLIALTSELPGLRNRR